ncbi:MAG: nucleoside deaminase [Actinomycetota bacterium]
MTQAEAAASSAREVFGALEAPWHIAFAEAWTSWRAGNFGIGAVLVDPATGQSVALGRNRVVQREPEPGLLSGNLFAHAEMNAFAALPRANAEGLDLYSTLEPCLMCAASAMQMKVARVFYAADDEFYDGLADVWAAHPLTRERQPLISGPFGGAQGRLAAFARLMPLTFTVRHFAGRAAEQRARAVHPQLAAVADDLLADGSLDSLLGHEHVVDAMDALWGRLE